MRDARTVIMLMPSISRYMTSQPVTIERSASLGVAHRMMREHRIRHLPVVDTDGNLCGIVSQRDLYLIETLAEPELEKTPVEDAMETRTFVVTSDMPLDEVAEIMSEQKYGCAIVAGKKGVEGIFTAVDACTTLAQVLRRAVD